MIELRWSDAATHDLQGIAEYLVEHAPGQAERIVLALYDAPAQLLRFPALGRPGRMGGTRELVLTGLPYVLIYVQRPEIIQVARVLHGAQKWP